MKPTRNPFAIASSTALLAALALLGNQGAQAANVTWDGGGSDAKWTTDNNWSTNAAWNTGNTAIFASAFTSGTSIDLNGNQTVAALTIDTTTLFSLNNNTLTVTSGDITRSAASGTTTINSAIAIGGAAAWNITGNLTAAGGVTGIFAMTKTGTGTVTLNGSSAFNGITLSAGTIAVGHNSALGTGTLKFQNGSGTIQSSSSTGYTLANAIEMHQATVIAGTGALDFSGTYTLKNNSHTLTVNNTALTTFSGATFTTDNIRTLTVDVAGTSGGVLISGVAQNGPAGASDALSISKAGTGTLTLSNNNSYTGTTTVTAGTLVVNGNQEAATGLVGVSNSGSRLAGTGTVGGNTTINSGAIHAPGAVGAVGKQTFDKALTATTNLTYSSGSIFEWDLASTPATTGRGTSYDAVNVAGTLGGTGAIFRVVLNGAQNFSEAFWNTTRTWSDIFKSADGGSNLSIASIFSSVQYYNATNGALSNIPATQGYFTFSGADMTWTAVPEPSSALAALLLGAGLLRRRR